MFEGEVTLGDDVRIGAHCVIRDAVIGNGTVVHPFTHIDGAQVGAGALIGPFARLRPGAQLADEVHIGNFVEVKNSTLARGAKANHLAYLGDATVGERHVASRCRCLAGSGLSRPARAERVQRPSSSAARHRSSQALALSAGWRSR